MQTNTEPVWGMVLGMLKAVELVVLVLEYG
jgi:hypothetical protein